MNGLADIAAEKGDDLSPPHPTQPLVRDNDGCVRFRANALVQALLKEHPQFSTVEDLAATGIFSREDLEQVVQLLGFSLEEARHLGYAAHVEGTPARGKGIFRKPHPIQPLVEVDLIRFKRNAVVRHLLDTGPLDLNALAMLDASRRDHEKFAQLIGYSFRGAGELSYVSDAVLDAAEDEFEQRQAQQRQQHLNETLPSVPKASSFPRI